MKTKWTVRNVDGEAIALLQKMRIETGLSLGRLVSRAITTFCENPPQDLFKATAVEEEEIGGQDDLAGSIARFQRLVARLSAGH
jgi:hypothetical protein